MSVAVSVRGRGGNGKRDGGRGAYVIVVMNVSFLAFRGVFSGFSFALFISVLVRVLFFAQLFWLIVFSCRFYFFIFWVAPLLVSVANRFFHSFVFLHTSAAQHYRSISEEPKTDGEKGTTPSGFHLSLRRSSPTFYLHPYASAATARSYAKAAAGELPSPL